jgi:hypothetical protein
MTIMNNTINIDWCNLCKNDIKCMNCYVNNVDTIMNKCKKCDLLKILYKNNYVLSMLEFDKIITEGGTILKSYYDKKRKIEKIYFDWILSRLKYFGKLDPHQLKKVDYLEDEIDIYIKII